MKERTRRVVSVDRCCPLYSSCVSIRVSGFQPPVGAQCLTLKEAKSGGNLSPPLSDGGQKPAPVIPMSGNDRSGLRLASGEMNQILNSVGNSSGPSVGASSLVTDANSGLSGGPRLQKSTSFNNESYMGLPASPISFSSNFSGSSVMDGCSIVQQSSLQEQDNSILYWRKFVAEYFAVRARKRWCLSLYDNMANNTLGVFPQLAVDAWQCGFCGSKSGKGFEATFEVLPRLFQIKFDHGVIDENLFLEMPHESRLSSGIMVLEYEKAVQESVYEHLHIVREGQLRIIFTPELKILLWEFCTRRHEEFLPRRLLAPQVNQLLQVAQKYQTTVTENNTAGVSHQDLQTSCNMFAAIGRQLARNFDLQSLNDLGFSKRYVRCLQISEVVSSMKDLIDFSQEQKIGAIESLKNYPRHAAAKLQKQKLDEEQVMSSHALPGDPSTLKKATGIQAGLNNYINNNLAASQVVNNSQQGVHALNSFQNMLRNTLNLKQNVLQEEALSSLSGSNQAQPLQFQGSASSVSIDASVSNLSGQHRPQPPLDVRLQQQYNPQNPQVNQHMQQHVIQQMLQEMMNNNKGASQQAVIAPNANAGLAAGDVTGGDITGTPVRIDTGSIRNALELQSMPTNLRNNGTGGMGSRSYSFQSAATASNPTISGNIINSRPDLPHNMGLPEMDHIAQEFAENGIFDADSW
ncbi:hypothetical protein C4D60_Mb10t20980 [Musa balbisiana]|uniref:Transcriptional regulator SLK2 n=1 Tax=Musa balbisiana TaxID=52838 RepID=A0A4S8IYR7_MUSBA|nr:hypothetical protein C4D60_Mb10t20980 [Musa balbisiana]